MTDTKLEQQTVTVTDKCKESAATNDAGDEACAICLSQDEYDYLFSDYDYDYDGQKK